MFSASIALHRRGMTLLEMVVVIGVQSVLLATAVGLIGRLLLTEQEGRKELQAMMSFQALAEQFRRDVNAAEQVAAPGAGGGVDFQLPANGRATYEIHDGRVERLERRETEIVRREAYRVPRTWNVLFEELSEGPHPIMRMTISKANVPQLSCEAVLGLDSAAAASSEGAESHAL